MYMHIHSRACAESLFSVRLLSFSDTLSFTALIHSLTLQRSLNGSPVPFLPRQNHLSFKIHSKRPRSDLRLLLERVAVEEEETFRITRQKYTCRVRRGGRTLAEKFSMRGRSYTAKVVDRDVVGRPSGKKESTVEPLLAASGRCYCSSSYFCLSSRSPRPGLFIPLSVTASLSFATSSLFLSFCPFSASANDSRLFIPRLCIARERARALLRLLTTAVSSAASVLLRRYFASLPFRSLLLSSVSFFSPSFS